MLMNVRNSSELLFRIFTGKPIVISYEVAQPFLPILGYIKA